MRMVTVLLLVCLSGCGDSKPNIPPVILRVFKTPEPVKQYITLPSELTVDCKDIKVENVPVLPIEDAAIWLANERKKANEECTERMRKIREKQGQLEK